jgi:hypothetical protein
MNYTALYRQSLLDIALQELGEASAVVELAMLNSIEITADIEAGQVIVLPNNANKPEVVRYYKDRKITLTTDIPRPNKSQVIVFAPIGSVEIGDVVTLNATATSGLPVLFVSTNPAVASVVNNTLTVLSGGVATIIASQAGDNIYYPVSVSQNLIVPKLQQTIEWSDLDLDVELSESPLLLVATATSGLPVSFLSSNSDVASISGNQLTLHKVGTVTITALQPGNEQWNEASASVMITISELQAPPIQISSLMIFDLVYEAEGVYPTFSWTNNDAYDEIRLYVRIREFYNEYPDYTTILQQSFSSEPIVLNGNESQYTITQDFYTASSSIYNPAHDSYNEYMLYIFVVGVKNGIEAENGEMNTNYMAITAAEIRLVFNF